MKKIFPLLFPLLFISFLVNAQEDEVFVIVEHMPTFVGGEEAMNKFFLDEMEYPKLAANGGIKGKVHLSFVVDEKGDISEVKILKGKPGGLNKEATRLVNKMPNWTPGKQGGQVVKVQMMVQVDFPLELKVYIDDNKKIRCTPMPNMDQYGGTMFYDSQYFVWYVNTGILALERKSYQEAEAIFNKALVMCGPTGMGSGHIYFNRAIARLYQGNESLACGDFRRARKVGYSEIDKTIKGMCGE
jgi:TonB family protein